jgi:hypothetical protein
MRKITNKDQAWESMWGPDVSGLSEFYDEHAELSAFSPPKQTTWKGLDAIKAVRNPRQCTLTSTLRILTTITVKAFQ